MPDPTLSTLRNDLTGVIEHLDLVPTTDGAFEQRLSDVYERNVIEGSHLIGQVIVAASRIVPDQRVVTVNATFSRPARFDSSLRFEPVVRHRGRNFSTVTVNVEQDEQAAATALLMLDGGAPDLVRQQSAMPDVAGPEDAAPYRPLVTGLDIRVVDDAYTRDPEVVGPPELRAWMRVRDQPDDPILRSALLVHFLGRLTVPTAMRPHRGIGIAMAHRSLSTGVMAMTINLHEDADLSDWLLLSYSSIHAGRGLATVDTEVFERSGRLVASCSTQVLLRRLDQTNVAKGRNLF